MKMGLTCDEFLKLATVIQHLYHSLYYFDDKKIGIKEKNRRVAAAAKDYFEFFNDSKYMQFMEEVRISFKKILKPSRVLKFPQKL